MPLNRNLTLPPHSLADTIKKMHSGYYDIDTEIVRQSFRVLTPAIKDYKLVGYYIARDCANLPTYQLEAITSPGTFFN
jgi:integral membrane protein 2C